MNGTQVCSGLSGASGLFMCNYQAIQQGTYEWNATTTGSNSTSLKGYFALGLMESINLLGGWILVSLPIVPANTQLSKVLAGQIVSKDFTVVWSYENGRWLSAMLSNGKLSGPLTTMQDGLGYWVYMAHSDTLYVTGSVIPPAAPPPAYPLSAGWNLIGFKPQPDPTASETVTTYLRSISASYDSSNVWVYDNTSQSWIRAGSSYALQPGQAMWILVSSSLVLQP